MNSKFQAKINMIFIQKHYFLLKFLIFQPNRKLLILLADAILTQDNMAIEDFSL